MAQWGALGLLSLCVLGLTSPLCAQDGDRIWGRVLTVSGEEHEGFIRWGSNEGSWVDALDGSKEIPQENYTAWLEANQLDRAVRVIELRGHRVSWEEEHPDFPLRARSAIRFGHIASLEVVGDNRVELLLRSRETVELQGGGDLGSWLGRIVVDQPGQREVRVRWRDLERITFSAVPPGARATSRRLHGTVEDELGRRFTGYVAWDLDEILEADVLDGREVGGIRRDREIPFARITSIERTRRGARVLLEDGAAVELTDSNDVDDGNRGIQISDPALGLVEVPWDQFRTVRFHSPDAPTTYDAFDGGRLLRGTVVTRGGEEIGGVIRWDADEASSWEFLDGRADEVTFKIEMSHVSRIERGEAFGALVTLADGRTFELDGANDVDWDNKGIMVAPENADRSDASAWRVIPWDDFREVRFR